MVAVEDLSGGLDRIAADVCASRGSAMLNLLINLTVRSNVHL